ncbi:class I SAM-dependent methyltransferase family protein [Methanolobus sp. ZRKC3]|uniref:class I SAM-dependent methyltransferase n=1 Tax=Methanolobus sp. ZRKC3 TaxID=3125786 RepID=UPI0032449360
MMNMEKAVVTPISEAEKMRKELREKGYLDLERKIRTINIDGNDFLEIPVTSDIEGMNIIEQQDPQYYRKWKSLGERIDDDLQEPYSGPIPSGWQILGDIIVVSIDEKSEDIKNLIAKKLLEMYPQCNTVVRDLGIEGQFRQPKREIIAGSQTETIHKENSCLFKLDVTKVMFSKGNLYEKKLMSNIGSDEVIVDMFAGIGYFSIPIAVHAKPEKIYSIELNPESYAYLVENVRLNKLSDTVEALNGDCTFLTPKGIADRVLMGYVGTTHHYLKQGIRALKPGGGMLHYHETTPEKLLFDRPLSRIKNAAVKEGKKVEIKECRKVKKYSPGVWHVVIDAWIY